MGDLPPAVSYNEVNTLFAEFGEISNIRLQKDKSGDTSRKPFAIIQFKTEEAAIAATQKYANYVYNGSEIRTMFYNRDFSK